MTQYKRESPNRGDDRVEDTAMTDEGKSKRVNRRSLMAGIGGGAAALLAAPHVARAQSPIIWKMATSWPKGSPGPGGNAQRLADMITSMSGGRLTVQLFGAGELVPPFEVFDAVASGAAECGHSSPYYWQGKDQAFHFFTGVPFGLTAEEHAGWLYFGGAQELWDKAYEPFGVVPFLAGSSGPQAGGWFAKEINTLDDLKGLKMRIAGLGGTVMRRLGVNVVLLPPGEIFAAMQAGTIDAAEWVGPWNDLAFGLYKVAPYYYMPAFHELGPALELIVNKAQLEMLPDDLREIVKRAAMASSMEALADFTFHNIESFRPLLEKEGVELRSFSPEIVSALAVESEKVLTDIASASPLAKEVYDSFLAYRAKATEYARSASLAALSMRDTGLPR
ncbi:TRAP transporter substrate-binding protein [Breoghania sp.]|uniref:TRAP transporter substrate-binding protein n=1 Tax=Breoghania sp. TaxID=2065378 RepID=UPI002AA6DBCC|nr:TRAP transporter substrate-binding protein [Breoghania sp.]